MTRSAVLALSALLVACAGKAQSPEPRPSPTTTCGDGAPMRVRFYDVGQALSALVELPDGRRVLVDTGESPKRPGCGKACADASAHLLDGLRRDLAGSALDLVWITHQHSDHLGGAPEVLSAFPVRAYADNGRDLGRPTVRRARDAADAKGIAVHVIGPGAAHAPLAAAPPVRVAPVVPAAWPKRCETDANECSIALRIDYCASSVLFVGDAEAGEEAVLDPGGPVSLLQVGHHGSETSTTDAFLAKVAPRYAVISSGRPGEGMNATYCHPRRATVERLAKAIGGAPGRPIRAFDGAVSCKGAGDEHWADTASPAGLWATARDGDVLLVTRGDGRFVRE